MPNPNMPEPKRFLSSKSLHKKQRIHLLGPDKNVGPPFVSVIIPVCNGENYLSEAIESILIQEFQPLEIIVVDGPSTDNTAKIAKSYDNIRYIQQPGRGLANARNTGIQLANGELISFLDHDDIWVPGKLDRQVRYHVDHPEIKYSITYLQKFLEPTAEKRFGSIKDTFSNGHVGYTPGALIAHKGLYHQIGGFNEAYAIGCDSEWFARAIDAEIPMAVIGDIMLFKRIHQTNLSANKQVYKDEILKMLRNSIQRKKVVSMLKRQSGT